MTDLEGEHGVWRDEECAERGRVVVEGLSLVREVQVAGHRDAAQLPYQLQHAAVKVTIGDKVASTGL